MKETTSEVKNYLKFNFSSTRRPNILSDFNKFLVNEEKREEERMRRFYGSGANARYFGGCGRSRDLWDDINEEEGYEDYGRGYQRWWEQHTANQFGLTGPQHPFITRNGMKVTTARGKHGKSTKHSKRGGRGGVSDEFIWDNENGWVNKRLFEDYKKRQEKIKNKNKKPSSMLDNEDDGDVFPLRLNPDTDEWERWDAEKRKWVTDGVDECAQSNNMFYDGTPEVVDKDVPNIPADACTNKKIHFYEDMSKAPLLFNNLYEFDNYLVEHDISTNDADVLKMMNNDEIYCAIDPLVLEEKQIKVLVTDNSYGGLRWSINNLSDEDEE